MLESGGRRGRVAAIDPFEGDGAGCFDGFDKGPKLDLEFLKM